MNKHTPGPWISECYINDRMGFVCEAREDGHSICDLRPHRKTIPDDKRKSAEWSLSETDLANARLIAAAPDLLAALQLVRMAPDFDVDSVIGQTVIAALAKA